MILGGFLCPFHRRLPMSVMREWANQEGGQLSAKAKTLS
jgi:hypothetical protein